MDSKGQDALRIAQELAREAKSSTDFHNAFFGIGGAFAKLFPSRSEREAFARTAEYQEILHLRAALEKPERAAS